MEPEPVIFSFRELANAVNTNVVKISELFRLSFFYLKIITGRGLEFDRLREFNYGDEARLLDWNAFARTQNPYTKIFKEERKLDFVVLVDVSNTMLLGTTEMTKSQYASVVAGIFSYAAYLSGDKIGALFFSDQVKYLLEPIYKEDNYHSLIKHLCKKEIYGGKKDWSCLSKYVFETFSQDTILFIISDFINFGLLEKEFLLNASNHFYKIFGVMVRDPIDTYIPENLGMACLADPVTGKAELMDLDKLREKYNEEAKREEFLIEQTFKEANSLFFKIHTNENFVNPFIRYFSKVEL